MSTTSALKAMHDLHSYVQDPPAGWSTYEAAIEVLKNAVSGSGSSSPAGAPVTVNTVYLGASASQIIPAGAKGWSYAVTLGTATVAGAASVPAGLGDSDSNILAASFTITTASASAAYVRWNT